jgi:hypothetical protein
MRTSGIPCVVLGFRRVDREDRNAVIFGSTSIAKYSWPTLCTPISPDQERALLICYLSNTFYTSVTEDQFVSREKHARSSQSIILGRCHGVVNYVLVLWLFLECMRAPTATSEVLIRNDFKKDLHSWQQYTKNIWADRFRTMWSKSLKSTINKLPKIPLFRKCLNWYTPSVGLW